MLGILAANLISKLIYLLPRHEALYKVVLEREFVTKGCGQLLDGTTAKAGEALT